MALMSMDKFMKAKLAKMKDDTLMEILHGDFHKDHVHDWRNWGRNIERLIAEEAHRRGLIE